MSDATRYVTGQLGLPAEDAEEIADRMLARHGLPRSTGSRSQAKRWAALARTRYPRRMTLRLGDAPAVGVTVCAA